MYLFPFDPNYVNDEEVCDCNTPFLAVVVVVGCLPAVVRKNKRIVFDTFISLSIVYDRMLN